MSKRFSQQKILRIVAERKAGKTVKQICQQYSISEPTFYRWQASLRNGQSPSLDNNIQIRLLMDIIGDLSAELQRLRNA